MKVREFLNDNNFELINAANLDIEISGVYCGDLLSWVMSHAKEKNVWCTVLTHVNIVAIASLVQLSCVIICENAPIDSDTVLKAKTEKINLYRTSLNSAQVIENWLMKNG